MFPTENFDSYTNGDNLNGKNGGSDWAGAWSVSAGTVTVSNAQSKSGLSTYLNVGTAVRAFSAVTTGVLSISAFPLQTNKNCDIYLRNAGLDTVVQILFVSNGQLWVYDGGVAVNLLTYSANTWYDLLIELDSVNQPNKFRIKIGEGAWSSWYAVRNSGAVTDLWLNNSSSGGSMYIDSIAPYTPPPFDYQLQFSNMT